MGRAKEAHDKMLNEVRSDGKTTINSSKLVNWIVSDYFENFFRRRRKALCKEHFNSRKCLLDAMKGDDPEKLKQALQEAARNLGKKKASRKKEHGTQEGGAAKEKSSC